MAKIVKMCDMNQDIAIEVFSKLNPEKIEIQKEYLLGLMKIVRIYTNVEPKDLIYPEGWYYAKGTFRNKHTSSTGVYHEVRMYKTSGESWDQYAKYCTLDE